MELLKAFRRGENRMEIFAFNDSETLKKKERTKPPPENLQIFPICVIISLENDYYMFDPNILPYIEKQTVHRYRTEPHKITITMRRRGDLFEIKLGHKTEL